MNFKRGLKFKKTTRLLELPIYPLFLSPQRQAIKENLHKIGKMSIELSKNKAKKIQELDEENETL